MKVCKTCGEEIATRDGDNHCDDCRNEQRSHKRKDAAKKRRQRDRLMSDLGLTKVRGAMGGTYWE